MYIDFNLLLLSMLFMNLSGIWPVGILSGQQLCPLDIYLSCFQYLLIFQQSKAHALFYPGFIYFSKFSVPLLADDYIETKIHAIDMYIATGTY